MVRLRLRRKGRIHHAVYDIVAIDKRKRRDGAFIERIGFYDPNTNPNTVTIEPERAIYWLNVGAQPSEIVGRILKQEGVMLRRALEFKNKPAAEIDEAVEAHKKNALERYYRLKQKRKDRAEAKKKAEEEAKKAEEEAAKAE